MSLKNLTATRSPVCEECNEFYDKKEKCPKQLACGHSVCLKCISKLKENAEYQGVIDCPKCKNPDVVGNSSPVDNKALLKLVEAVPRCATHSSSCITFCMTCHEALCKKCSVEAMSNQKHTGHDLRDYKDGMIAIHEKLQKGLNGVTEAYDRHVKSVLQAVRSAAEQDADDVSDSIRSSGECAIEHIRAWMESSLKTVTDAASSNTRILTDAEKSARGGVDEVTTEINRIDDKLTALMAKDQVESALRSCSKLSDTMGKYKPPRCSSYTFKKYQLELPDLSKRNLVWSTAK